MTNSKPTLLFIPDISGFTDFVNKTEINHSRHIISELLELIINADQLEMMVSEIEGDAVLFFKETVPSISELLQQCYKTFTNFHEHLQRYDTERICRCGACETASQLSLKFVIHSGDVQKIDIKNHHKLHGSDVILAHRLLKNSIPGREYILISENIGLEPLVESVKQYDWTIKKGNESFENLGKIEYTFIPLKKLFDHLSDNSSIQFPELSANKIQFEKAITAPIDLIYENFTNFEKRMEWNEDIKEIILHGNSLNKTGSLHTCLVGPYSLDIESIGRFEDNEKIVYGERLNKFKGLRDIISIYTFEKRGNQTLVKIEVDFRINSWFGKLMKSIVRRMLEKQTKDGLNKLKKVSEKNVS